VVSFTIELFYNKEKQAGLVITDVVLVFSAYYSRPDASVRNQTQAFTS
jgi:hypothetical protein